MTLLSNVRMTAKPFTNITEKIPYLIIDLAVPIA
jgi:hypothetical protein